MEYNELRKLENKKVHKYETVYDVAKRLGFNIPKKDRRLSNFVASQCSDLKLHHYLLRFPIKNKTVENAVLDYCQKTGLKKNKF